MGLGTGSTAEYFIRLLGRRVQEEGLSIQAVPTSKSSEQLARNMGIPLTSFQAITHLDVTVDGADEFDERLRLIKGGGGALLREKVVASASETYIIIVDSSKKVETLGRFPLPVEVIPFAWPVVAGRLEHLGARTALRKRDSEVFETVCGNYIIDCRFGFIAQPEQLARQIRDIPGVVEHGLFLDLVDVLVIGRGPGVEILKAD